MVKSSRREDQKKDGRDWVKSLPVIAGNHSQVAGVLSGFSITIAVLVATFLLSEGSALAATNRTLAEYAFGIFMVSFFGYTATGVTFSQVSASETPQEFFVFSVASILHYLSVILSFLGLLVFVRVIGVAFLVLPVSFFVVGSAIGGCLVIFSTQMTLLEVTGKTAVVVTLIAAAVTSGLVSMTPLAPALRDGVLMLRSAVWAPTVAIVVLFLSAMLSLLRQSESSTKRFAFWSVVLSGLVTTAVFFLTAISIGFVI